jgi:hypothetical protein
MTTCATCGHFTLSPKYHTCPPEWEARDADDCDDDWEVIRAPDADDAATKYAEECDDGSGEGAHERTVLVRAIGSTDVKRFEITFDYSVDYYATEKPA